MTNYRTLERVYSLMAFTLIFMGCVTLTGCLSTMFRDKVEYKRVDVERYNPHTGRPRKMCRIIQKGTIEVEFTDKSGNTWTEKINLEGWNASPPALPVPEKPDAPNSAKEPKAELVPSEKPAA